MYKLRNFSFFIAGILLIVACVGTKPKAGKGKKQCYESFFINDSTMQYFIKPITFKNADQKVVIDFTFRKSGNTFSAVTTNFTYFTENKTTLNSFSLAGDSIIYQAKSQKMLYKERDKKRIKYRYSTMFDYKTVRKSFLSGDLFLIINRDLKFYPTRRSSGRIEKINAFIFDFL